MSLGTSDSILSPSPTGQHFLTSAGSLLKIWHTPSPTTRSFQSFTLMRTLAGHRGDITGASWSKDGRFALTWGKDNMVRLWWIIDADEGWKSKTFAGHRGEIRGAWFSQDEKEIYTVSKDGALFVWSAKMATAADDDDEDDIPQPIMDLPSTSTTVSNTSTDNTLAYTRWGITSRHYFNFPQTTVTSCTFHPTSSLLVVGFSSGVFGLWTLPDFVNVHTLSISQEKITSVAINDSGDWLVFGGKKLGQLLVWEWKSESYILKQQGHYFSDMNTLSWSPDGQIIATGGDDGKVKLWNTKSGFCFVTFEEHTASVSQVLFAKQGSILFSSSLDGTIRAFDLTRYRNFRTFTSPTPVQFSSLAVDESGDVLAAGSIDSFEIYLWDVRTGKLLDILSGHTGPISSLEFSPGASSQLASSSWDRTIRVWSVFGRSGKSEPFELNSDVLKLCWRPDGKELACSTLDGNISFWDPEASEQVNLIEGRKDISGGRSSSDRNTSKNSTSGGKSFDSLTYTADGNCLLAGGNSKYVLLYDTKDGVMLKKFQISENLSLDGTEEMLDSRKIGADGLPIDLIDTRGEESDLEDRIDRSLPGAQKGDLSKRKYKRAAMTKDVRFSPNGRSFACASTEGLLIYSLDEDVAFDPFDLDVDVTPQSILETLAEKEFLKALIISFRLSEKSLIQRSYESVPPSSIPLIVKQLPVVYLPALIRFISEHMEKSPHVEFDLLWVQAVLISHGRYLRDKSGEYAGAFRGVHKGVVDFKTNISRISEENSFTLSYIIHQVKGDVDEMQVDGEDRL